MLIKINKSIILLNILSNILLNNNNISNNF